METQRSKIGFAAWVSGWSLLVGALLVVLPAYLLAGRQVALLSAAGVVGASLCLAWLGVEFAGALRAAAPAKEREAMPSRALTRTH